MDLSKLNANERLAFWGAALSIVGTILTFFGYAGGGGGLWLTFLLAIAMIVILFLPTWSPGTSLPGSKGTLMVIVGGIAAIGAVLGLFGLLALLSFAGAFAGFILMPLLGLAIGIIGGLMMGWGGWKEFQAEGANFRLGGSAGGSATAASTPPPAGQADTRTDRPAEPAPAASEPPPAAAPPPAAPPDDRPVDREDRPTG